MRIDPAWLARNLGGQPDWRPFTNESRPGAAAILGRLAASGGAVLREPLAAAGAIFALTAHLDAENRAGSPASALDRALVGRIEEWVEAHLSDEIELADLARLAGLSPWQFSRRFRATLGVSPYRFVTHVRLRRAKVLLTETTVPLARIAAATGFHDQAHFANTFRRFSGGTPKAYRAG